VFVQEATFYSTSDPLANPVALLPSPVHGNLAQNRMIVIIEADGLKIAGMGRPNCAGKIEAWPRAACVKPIERARPSNRNSRAGSMASARDCRQRRL
jgi:hypothetical protein